MEETSKRSFLENGKLNFLTSLYFNHGTPVKTRWQVNHFSALHSFCSNYLLVVTTVFQKELRWRLDNRNKRNAILQGSGKRINKEVTKSAGLKSFSLVKVNISWSDF